ncbi:hypothetical protein L9F63_009708 [Diploptera punctata]|uniref:Uncharacterized protein n=1 Tax=Diploptera punctata TaxID=6984 RepID=A0AAD8ERG1_DIPPU|nr:hypothetical protein L9F63_009708 [Diploptera punctata]
MPYVAYKQFRSESYFTYVRDYESLVLAPPTCVSAPGELLTSNALCTVDSEDLDWSYSEECSLRTG